MRAAGEGASDAREAIRARQSRAAEPDVVAALAALAVGSPTSQRMRSALRALGVTERAMVASLRWWRARRDRADDVDDRPIIRTGPDLHVDVAAALDALTDDPELYAREGMLVRVTREPGGEPTIRPHTVATLRVRLARFAQFVDRNGDGIVPPDAITIGILEAAEWPRIRQLAGITESPTMREDCSICQAPGYDPATRLLYLPTIEFPEVPESPTQDQCAEAMRFAWVETSYDFPYRGLGYADPAALATDPDGVHRFLAARECADAWGLVAAIATILARPAIAGDCPAIAFDSAGPGTGKGMQLDVACLATLGRVPSKLTWPARGEKAETDAEVGKRLDGEVLGGAQVIAWDEVLGAFGGPAINNVLTCGGRTKVRPLGTSTTHSLPYRAVMLAAGNNITCRDNTHRRILVPRIESPDANPEEHEGWRCEDLRANVRGLRAQIATAILTVVRGYHVAGRPDMGLRWGGYEPWAALVASAIVWAGGGNVMGCRPTLDPDARNEERDTAAAIVDAVAKLEPKGHDGAPTGAGMTLSSLIDALYTRERLKGEAPPDGYDDAREAIDAITKNAPGRKPSARKLGDEIKGWKGRNVGDGRMLTRAAKKDRTNVQRWTVTTIGKVAAPVAPEPETYEQRLAREAAAERDYE
ncbi:MAG TPA: hypothetical protein PKZ08_13965 [Vicinamibacterales bacterium]|nr:hypothetical protein [Vicinamibacterales bacterium]